MMQDRYLFRAKRKDSGEWVQGYYVKGLDVLTNCEEDHIIFEPNTMFYSSGETDGWYRVDPSTICQCTGLKDKNGKLIWENDIVKHYNDDAHPESCCTGTVLWDENYAGFYRTSNEYGLSKPRISSDCIYEVVGNTFDNQELFEE